MSWSLDTSNARVKKWSKDRKTEDYEVVELTRERDFENLDPTTICRAKAAHLYADITNLHLLVSEAGGDKDEQKKIVRAVSTLRRIQGSLACDSEIARLQVQGGRFHGICHKPYDGEDEDNEPRRALSAVTFSITLQSYLYDVFNDVFNDVGSFRGAVGVDSGAFLIANVGYRGDREIISLGSPANLAAKAIGESGTITITKRVFDLLPNCLQEHFEESAAVGGVSTYQASGLRWKKYPDLAEELGVQFDHDKWKRETQQAKDNLPLSDMGVSGVEAAIDLEALSERNSKRTDAVPFYADLDGFTKCVQQAEKDNDVKTLVREFHLIRAEFQAVIESDYDGLVVQHQGDCALGLAYLPAGDTNDGRRRRKAIDIAIGLQSSMEHVLPKYIVAGSELGLAIGVASGQVLLTRLGKKGEREMVLLGSSVDEAQRLQTISAARQIRISAEVYDAINDDIVKGEFDESGKSYVATGLTFPKLEQLDQEKEERAARAGSLGAKATSAGITVITDSRTPLRPYAP